MNEIKSLLEEQGYSVVKNENGITFNELVEELDCVYQVRNINDMYEIETIKDNEVIDIQSMSFVELYQTILEY